RSVGGSPGSCKAREAPAQGYLPDCARRQRGARNGGRPAESRDEGLRRQPERVRRLVPRVGARPMMDTIAVIDFETTGISPEHGARATEIAAVLVRDGVVVDRYQSLMNAGAWVPPFIEALTGISNEMVRAAPPAARVM